MEFYSPTDISARVRPAGLQDLDTTSLIAAQGATSNDLGRWLRAGTPHADPVTRFSDVTRSCRASQLSALTAEDQLFDVLEILVNGSYQVIGFSIWKFPGNWPIKYGNPGLTMTQEDRNSISDSVRDPRVQLRMLGIHENALGKGWGKMYFNYDRGFPKPVAITLFASVGTKGFFDKCGCVKTGENELEDATDPRLIYSMVREEAFEEFPFS